MTELKLPSSPGMPFSAKEARERLNEKLIEPIFVQIEEAINRGKSFAQFGILEDVNYGDAFGNCLKPEHIQMLKDLGYVVEKDGAVDQIGRPIRKADIIRGPQPVLCWRVSW